MSSDARMLLPTVTRYLVLHPTIGASRLLQVFKVISVTRGTGPRPLHEITIEAVIDNSLESEELPLAPYI